MLSQTVILVYRQKALQVLIGDKKIVLNAKERRKATTDAIDIQQASLMITTVDAN